MPRNVRNFWIEAHVDGRAVKLAAGPASRYGGFTLTVYQRDKGGVMEALRLYGRECNGELHLFAEPRTPTDNVKVAPSIVAGVAGFKIVTVR
jgi:hypothetical protein